MDALLVARERGEPIDLILIDPQPVGDPELLPDEALERVQPVPSRDGSARMCVPFSRALIAGRAHRSGALRWAPLLSVARAQGLLVDLATLVRSIASADTLGEAWPKVVLADAIERTSVGKIDKKALRARYGQ